MFKTTTSINNNLKEAHGLGRQTLEELLLNPSFKSYECLTLENKQEVIEKHRQFYLQEKEHNKENNDYLAKWAGCKTQGINMFKTNEEIVIDTDTNANANTNKTEIEETNEDAGGENKADANDDNSTTSLRSRDIDRNNTRNAHANISPIVNRGEETIEN